MRVLTWNLFHGRAVPPAGRDLEDEFCAALADWDWDVALLQEVPPWWAPALARACGAHARSAATSRNALAPLRRALARRAPDVAGSHGGGANVVLVRASVAAIVAHRRVLLRRWPERRVCHAVRLTDGSWWANLHAQAHAPPRARADVAAAATAVLGWAGEEPVVLGGDFNLRAPAAAGFAHVGGRGVDHVLARGARAVAPPRSPERGELSDHPPVLVEVRLGAGCAR